MPLIPLAEGVFSFAVNSVNNITKDPIFVRVFENQTDLPHESMIYVDFDGENKVQRLHPERTQEALMNLINGGFVLSSFTGWDRQTEGDQQAF